VLFLPVHKLLDPPKLGETDWILRGPAVYIDSFMFIFYPNVFTVPRVSNFKADVFHFYYTDVKTRICIQA
jgi:hypothetical protein